MHICIRRRGHLANEADNVYIAYPHDVLNQMIYVNEYLFYTAFNIWYDLFCFVNDSHT